MSNASQGRQLLTNARIVAADRLIEGGTVVIEGGAVAEVASRSYPSGPGVLDLGGRFLLPGLVDLHNDALEQEIAPRPGAAFDPAFALLHLDRKLAAAGITTEFHAIYFAERDNGRSITFANALTSAIAALRDTPQATVDHQILYRFDLRSPDAFAPLLAALDNATIPYASFNDHVPGQGQLNDLAIYRDHLRDTLPPNTTEAEIDATIQQQLASAAESDAIARDLTQRLAAEGRRRGLILSSHDDDTSEKVELMHRLGCTVAEFPITVAAAQRAAELGLLIAMGAPNAVRGGSLTGNASALDLLSRGLVDFLIADYHASSLLHAVFLVADRGLRDLPAAVQLATATPACAVGLTDRGTIAPGQRADLIAVEYHGTMPVVAATYTQGHLRYASGPLLATLATTHPAPLATG